MRYKAAIFDLDGTLLDTLDDLWDAVNAVMAHYGYPARTREEVRSFVGNGVERLIELCLPDGPDTPDFAGIVAYYRTYYNAHSEVKTRPYDGVTELIDRLGKAGIRTAVVSNKAHTATVNLCRKYFPGIGTVGGEREADGVRRKPYPDMVLRAVEEIGVNPSDCAYIGDSEVDVLTAKNAGMDCISVLWGFRDRDMLESEGADCFAETTDEVYRILAE
ncbi:MAG: HAD family hydrolase [Clostridia bacterium]|nr:HAD family hydrolase [Clostridia bacterium]